MRWVALGIVLAMILVSAIAGCGSEVPASLNAPSTGDCAGIPTIPRDHPPDSLNLTRDPTLEAKFPDLIDGMPVQDVASARWIETLCSLGGQASVDAARQNVPAGMGLDEMTVGSGQTVVDGLAVTVTAFRLPNHRGDELIPVIGGLSSALTASPPKFTSDLEDVTAGGRAVKRWTNAADGATSYLYASGDTLFVIEGVTPSQADKVLAALN